MQFMVKKEIITKRRYKVDSSVVFECCICGKVFMNENGKAVYFSDNGNKYTDKFNRSVDKDSPLSLSYCPDCKIKKKIKRKDNIL